MALDPKKIAESVDTQIAELAGRKLGLLEELERVNEQLTKLRAWKEGFILAEKMVPSPEPKE